KIRQGQGDRSVDVESGVGNTVGSDRWRSALGDDVGNLGGGDGRIELLEQKGGSGDVGGGKTGSRGVIDVCGSLTGDVVSGGRVVDAGRQEIEARAALGSRR